MKRIDQLTFTRFIAALAVVLFHNARSVFPFNKHPIDFIFASGYIAVTYFFVLSGFVLSVAYSPLQKKFNPREYFFARFARIYPIYLLAFLITCVYYIHDIAKIDSAKILANLFLVQAWIPSYAVSFNFVAWSLSVEMFLYLIFPLVLPIFARLSTRNLILVAGLFWAFAQCITSYALTHVSTETFRYLVYFPPVYLSCFIVGMAAGFWYQKFDKASTRTSVNLGVLFLGLVLLILGLVFQQRLYRLPIFNTLSFGLLAPVYVLIIVPLALDTTPLAWILSHPWLRTLGDASYALFIINIPLRWFAERAVETYKLQISLPLFKYSFIIAVILISIVTYFKFEHPVRAWLTANKRMLWLFALDIAALSLVIWLAFFVRFGSGNLAANWKTFLFALRVGLPVTMLLFIVFRLYDPAALVNNIRVAALGVPAIALSGAALAGLAYWAYQNKMVESFPRTIFILVVVLIAVAGASTRFAFRRFLAAV